MQTAGMCLARYKAENVDYARGQSNTAALLGTSCHAALETYVKVCYIEKTQEPSEKLLLDLFAMNYIITFGNSDTKTEDYRDGVKMLKAWFKRTDFSTFEVLSCEIKENFALPAIFDKTKGKEDVPFNYIWDRHDRIDAGVVRVVDYKTNRASVSPADLRGKIQARAYGLAAQIKYPDAERIWVEFDMLRHDGPVGTVFTREDNAATWRFLKGEAQRIADADDSKPLPETLNPDCGYCVRKVNCQVARRNIAVGGVLSLTPIERVDRRAELSFQKRAVEAALSELDQVIIAEGRAEDVIEFEGQFNTQKITAKNMRSVDPDLAFRIIGPQLTAKYGGSKLTMDSVDRLLSGDEIDEKQKRQLSGLIRNNKSEPFVQSKRKPGVS